MIGRRFDGTPVPHTVLGVCDVEGCEENAHTEECNAEGDEGRMHWHGTLHVPNPRYGSGQLCPRHAEECRQEWRRLHAQATSDSRTSQT